MGKLVVFNFVLIALIAGGLFLIRKYAKTDRTKNIILLVAAASTILLHYSTLFFKLFAGDDAFAYLRQAPNLLLPIYPCNVVMWCALLFACLKNKRSKFGMLLSDYLFWFGIVSTLVGMFANVDFINNPTLADYANFKSITAHATLLFNILLLPLFGYNKIQVKRNMVHMVISILAMAVIGCYCNLIFHVVGSEDVAYEINAMFLIHSPFAGVSFLTYPVIALCAIPIYFAIFAICDLCVHKAGERFFDRKKV
jgi:hypothetical protein